MEAHHATTDEPNENFTTYHVRECVEIHSTFKTDELEIKDYYNHTYINGPKAKEFVDKFCGDKEGDFTAVLKKSPLLDEANHYHYAIK